MALPRGIRNNNPLNIVKGANWLGERPNQTDPRFEEFVSLEMGCRAGFVLLRNYITGRNSAKMRFNTIRKIVNRWAPPIENATSAYVATVCKRTGFAPDDVLFFNNRSAMVDLFLAMAYVECGSVLDRSVVETAYDLI